MTISEGKTKNVCIAAADACYNPVEKEFQIGEQKVTYTKCFAFCPPGTFLQRDGVTCGQSCTPAVFELIEVGSNRHRVCLESADSC